MKQLSHEEVLFIATLVHLTLTSEEIDRFALQLTQTISFISNLSELPTSEVKSTNNGALLKNVIFEDGKSCERMLSQENATQNAPLVKNGLFVVKRIM